jgi:hypothetical protein
VRIAASCVGAVRKAVAACDRWCSEKRILSAGTPSHERMIPFTQSFPPRELFIA